MIYASSTPSSLDPFSDTFRRVVFGQFVAGLGMKEDTCPRRVLRVYRLPRLTWLELGRRQLSVAEQEYTAVPAPRVREFLCIHLAQLHRDDVTDHVSDHINLPDVLLIHSVMSSCPYSSSRVLFLPVLVILRVYLLHTRYVSSLTGCLHYSLVLIEFGMPLQ